MHILIGKIKCCFCGKKDGLISSVPDYDTYGSVGFRYYYHRECLMLVEMNPEKFGHRAVDKAIFITEREKYALEVNETIAEDFKDKVEKLQRNSLERMMPKSTKPVKPAPPPKRIVGP
jgi:predicted transcriptional regulator